MLGFGSIPAENLNIHCNDYRQQFFFYDNDVVAHSAKYHLSKSERNRRITSKGIFFDITQDSKEKLLANEEVKSVGLSCNIKTVKENSKELSLIYYDDDMLSLIPAFDGKYPEKASEIAVTDAFFASENKSPEINAIVQLNLDGTLKNYTIVGIYHDKTSTAYPVFVSLEKCRELRGNNLLNGYVWLENADTLTKTKQQKYYLKFQRRLD